ncbi:MAG: DUF4310 family protein [Mixta calida]|nr:DUF4310 family protein [Mixta calida]
MAMILVAIDNSDVSRKVVSLAAEQARALKTQVMVLCCIDPAYATYGEPLEITAGEDPADFGAALDEQNTAELVIRHALAQLLGAGIEFPVTNFAASLATGLVIGLAIGYVIILARKFTINQSDSTYGADVMMGAGNASGRFLGPLIILSAMGASIPIGLGSLIGALLFYLWNKPITGGAILGAMVLGAIFPVAL